VKNFVVVQAAIAVGIAAALGTTIPLARGDARSPTIAPSEIKEGMKGYGLTVFKGTEPEKFDVEVVGVIKNVRPAQELILVKTPHPRLNITKNVKGMSGSPIFFGARLAGAYAYSLASFQAEPVAGVTPIAPMLAELHRPIPPGFWPLEGQTQGVLPTAAPAAPRRDHHASTSPTQWEGEPGTYDLGAHAKALAARFTPVDPSRPLVPTATPVMIGGVGDRTAEYVRKLFEPLGLEPLQAGGGGGPQDPSAPMHFVDGGTLGVSYASGDVSFFGLGTVTHVEGTKACGFGHPMMEAGNMAFPTAIAKVLWIYASDQHSFKVGESVRPLGALVQDRQSAVVVDETKTAPTFPVHVEIKGVVGAPKLVWDARIAEDKFMAPGITASVIGSAVEATTSERRDCTWKLVSTLKVRGHGEIVLEDFGIAVGGMLDSGEMGGTRIIRALGDVVNNPWEDVKIEGISSVLTVDYTREVYRMRGVELLDSVVDAGADARVRVKLFPLHGPDVTRVLEFKVPEELAGKDVEVEILPGYAIAPDVASPESLNDLMANETRAMLAPRTLVTQIKTSQGVVFHNHVAQHLPSFALDALRAQGTNTGPDAIQSYARASFPVDRYVDGHDKVKIKVRPIMR